MINSVSNWVKSGLSCVRQANRLQDCSGNARQGIDCLDRNPQAWDCKIHDYKSLQKPANAGHNSMLNENLHLPLSDIF
jgi:hypothetical protein